MRDPFEQAMEFAARLEAADIHYRLDIVRDGALMFSVAVPGERWEVEFMADGSVEVEIFTSAGDIDGRKAIARLFDDFAD